MKSVIKHRTAVFLIVAVILVCAAYGLYQVLHRSGVQSTDDAYIRADSVLVAPRVAGVVTEVLVQDNQSVKAGQQIAEMGRSGASRDMLHFEIRYNGKPVDPLQYLPAP